MLKIIGQILSAGKVVQERGPAQFGAIECFCDSITCCCCGMLRRAPSNSWCSPEDKIGDVADMEGELNAK
jgi:hypothetical protein